MQKIFTMFLIYLHRWLKEIVKHLNHTKVPFLINSTKYMFGDEALSVDQVMNVFPLTFFFWLFSPFRLDVWVFFMETMSYRM